MSRMSIILFFCVQAVSAQKYDFSAVDRLLQDSLQTAFNGNVLVLIEQNDELIYRFQAGNIVEETRRAIASCTKWVSGAVVLALAEKGYFSLEDTVGQYLPIFSRNGKGHFTIRQAFSMTSGLFSSERYEIKSTLTLEESVDLIAENTPMYFAPGTMMAYDGSGMQTVGRIAEVVTGKDWQTIAREQILDKCGMSATTYDVFGKNPAIAGGIRSSARDYMRFLRMVFHDGMHQGERVLSTESINEMFTNQSGTAPVFYSPFPHGHSDYAYGADTLRYAFGTWVFAENPMTRTVEEVSSPGAFGSYPWIDRKRNLVGITFTFLLVNGRRDRDTQLKMMRMVREIIDGTTGVKDGTTLPRTAFLHPSYPNPFAVQQRTAVTIRFQLNRAADIELAVYDLSGRLVRTLMRGPQRAGMHTLQWDGRDANGQAVASGVYLYRLRSGGQVQVRRMVVLR